jgi:putative aldouronate transport system substrate-binding protein
MFRKIFVIVVATAVIGAVAVSSLFGAGKKEAAAAAPQFIDGRYDPPLTISTPMSVHDPDNWPEGDSFEYNAYTRWVERELGIKFEASWFYPDHDTNVQRLSLAMAAADMPDLMYVPDAEVAKLARGGALMPLDSVVAEYASPLTEYIIEIGQQQVGGTLFLPYTIDGQFYGIPHSPENVWNVDWIRSDIVEELGFDLPRTLDDLEAILEAHHERYPDRAGHILTESLGGMETVMHALGAYPKFWIENGEGELVYGSVQPEVRDGLEILARWYRDGWLDPEFVVKDFNKAILEPVADGRTLSKRGPWWHVWWPWPDFWANDPDGQIMPYGPLVNVHGEVTAVVESPFYGWGSALRTGFEYPEALMYLLNEVNDSYHRNNHEIRDIMRERGYTFKYPVTELQEPLNPDAPEPFLYRYEYEKPGFGFFNDGASHFNRSIGFFLFALPDPHFRPGGNYPTIMEAYKSGTIDQLSAEHRAEFRNLSDIERRLESHFSTVEILLDIQDRGAVQYNQYMGAPTDGMAEHQAYLNRLEEETFVRIIMNEEPITAFDTFVRQWRNAGGDRITREVNEWYR